MQVLKDNSKKIILEVARKEFLKIGFRHTSMREIASKSEIGLSNIYNYFKNKDEILHVLVAPLLAAFEKIKEEHNKEKYLTIDAFFSRDYHEESVNMWLDLYKNFKEELFLVFHRSEGSKLASFKENMIDDVTDMSLTYFAEMKARYPKLHVNISDFFIGISISWWSSALEKLVADEFSEEEVTQFLHEYVEYSTAGWKSLMNV
ncbi:MAG: TetR/AcrR family transcriptional regulator [Bacteroidota bacterium]